MDYLVLKPDVFGGELKAAGDIIPGDDRDWSGLVAAGIVRPYDGGSNGASDTGLAALVERLRSSVASAEQINRELTADLAERDEQNSALSARVDALETEAKDLREALAERSTAFDELSASIAANGTAAPASESVPAAPSAPATDETPPAANVGDETAPAAPAEPASTTTPEPETTPAEPATGFSALSQVETGDEAPADELPAVDTPPTATIVETEGGWLKVMAGDTKIGRSTRDQAEADKILKDYLANGESA